MEQNETNWMNRTIDPKGQDGHIEEFEPIEQFEHIEHIKQMEQIELNGTK